jgi:hypothetical protein
MFGWLRQAVVGGASSREAARQEVELQERRIKMLERLMEMTGHREDRREDRREDDREEQRGEQREGGCSSGVPGGGSGLGFEIGGNCEARTAGMEGRPIPEHIVDMLRKVAEVEGQEIVDEPMAYMERRDGEDLTDSDWAAMFGEMETKVRAKLGKTEKMASQMKAMGAKGVIYTMSRELWMMSMHHYMAEMYRGHYTSEGLGEHDHDEPEMDMDRVSGMARNSIRASKAFYQMIDEMEVRVSDGD